MSMGTGVLPLLFTAPVQACWGRACISSLAVHAGPHSTDLSHVQHATCNPQERVPVDSEGARAHHVAR